MYGSLLFGGLFLWVVAPGWPPPHAATIALVPAIIAAVGAVGAAGAGRLSVRRLHANASPAGWLTCALAAHVLGAAALGWMAGRIDDPTRHAQGAILFVLLIYAGLRSGLGAVLSGYGLWRWNAGYVSRIRSLDLRIGRAWHDYAAVSGLVALAAA